jgi:hypothetical protein
VGTAADAADRLGSPEALAALRFAPPSIRTGLAWGALFAVATFGQCLHLAGNGRSSCLPTATFGNQLLAPMTAVGLGGELTLRRSTNL